MAYASPLQEAGEAAGMAASASDRKMGKMELYVRAAEAAELADDRKAVTSEPEEQPPLTLGRPQTNCP
jgi:hypothetical protein